MEVKRLERAFFTRDVLEVSPDLLGKLLVFRQESGELLKYRITGTEAYRGEEDTACHASKGKTARTSVMYSQGGFAYVYLCYGIHSLLNIVTGTEGAPQAALIRGVAGFDGPGKLTKAIGINRSFNGEDFCLSNRLWLEEDSFKAEYSTAPRVGINYAAPEDRERPWRFILS
ncbi:MAG: DNA-3-methyladenine glycosylase [Oscillospiraceae bacterium]|jgi:DNA-3-methyladenine glycosylase|nr:DNA-3-methyladenine glycosylase [Oscillospiraceae bacterium]